LLLRLPVGAPPRCCDWWHPRRALTGSRSFALNGCPPRAGNDSAALSFPIAASARGDL